MKINKTAVILAITAAIVLIVLTARPWGTKPFKDLTESDITSVSLELIPPGKTLDLTSAQTTDLVTRLQSIVIYNKEPLEPLAGQAVIFTITNTDGTTVIIEPMGGFMQIDGVRYKTKYEPSENLNRFANELEQKSR